MPHDGLFREIVAALVVMLYVPRLVYKKQFPRKEIGNETSVIVAVCLWTISLGAYLVGLELLVRIPVPTWLRWGGVWGMALCLPLSVWTYRSLGAHFSTKLRLLENHRIVREGPYRFVRHPMYAALFLCVASASLVSASVDIALAGSIVIVVLALRIRREEAMLEERFGKDYREYMQKTGAIVPKLRMSR